MKLKPCPFCGIIPTATCYKNRSSPPMPNELWWEVCCDSEECDGLIAVATESFTVEVDAIYTWNTRAAAPETPEPEDPNPS